MKLKFISIDANMKLLDALEETDKKNADIILIYDSNTFLGYIDDIRLRNLITDIRKLAHPIKDYVLNNVLVTTENIDRKSKSLKDYSLIINLDKNNHEHIEVIGKNGYNLHKEIKDVPVVIMAGGLGTRLRPFTKIIPKPLMPVGDKAILEHIIGEFVKFGLKDFYLTLNYKANFIKAYFKELNPDYNVYYVDENKPLGTAGALKFLQGTLKKPFFVTNCDTIIKVNYKKLYNFHLKNNFDMTLIGAIEKVDIPFGVCKVDDNFNLISIDEKPSNYFLINSGMYILNPDILELIPFNEFFHITHLMERVKKEGGKVGVYPVSKNTWIDLGTLKEFKENIDKLL